MVLFGHCRQSHRATHPSAPGDQYSVYMYKYIYIHKRYHIFTGVIKSRSEGYFLKVIMGLSWLVVLLYIEIHTSMVI